MKKIVFENHKVGTWTYENQGDEITGVLIKQDEDVGPSSSALYTLETKDHGIMAVWGSVILDQRMIGIKIGDLIKIIFKGLGEAKKGKNAPKIFQVLIDKEISN